MISFAQLVTRTIICLRLCQYSGYGIACATTYLPQRICSSKRLWWLVVFESRGTEKAMCNYVNAPPMIRSTIKVTTAFQSMMLNDGLSVCNSVYACVYMYLCKWLRSFRQPALMLNRNRKYPHRPQACCYRAKVQSRMNRERNF